MRAISLIFALALAGCAQQPDRIAETPSGRPEALFTKTTPGAVAGKIADGCAQVGLLVIEMRDSSVTCENKMDFNAQLLANLAVGTKYSTPARDLGRFTIFAIGANVRVHLYSWIEAQTAYGQTRKLENNNNTDFNGGMVFLRYLGGT